MGLCKYANIFGEHGKGVHSFRIFNIAIVDVVLTIIIAYFINKKFKKGFYKTLLIIFIIGIISHRIFCVKTTIDKIIFN